MVQRFPHAGCHAGQWGTARKRAVHDKQFHPARQREQGKPCEGETLAFFHGRTFSLGVAGQVRRVFLVF